jgi:hypothetical protein
MSGRHGYGFSVQILDHHFQETHRGIEEAVEQEDRGSSRTRSGGWGYGNISSGRWVRALVMILDH